MLATLSSLGLDVSRVALESGASAIRAYINSLYPDEFEYYLCSFELMNDVGVVEQVLIFPVMPDSIQESRTSLVNVKKTMSSVVSLTNNTFAPTTVNITGSFGKKLRILLGPKQTTASAFYFEKQIKVANETIELNAEIKSGYGVTKKLEQMIKKSQREEGYLLFFYNLALNNNYLVEVTDMSFQQSMENNMLWNYSLSMKSLANAEDVRPGGKDAYKKSINEMLKFQNINKAVSKMVDTLKSVKYVGNEVLDKMGVI